MSKRKALFVVLCIAAGSAVGLFAARNVALAENDRPSPRAEKSCCGGHWGETVAVVETGTAELAKKGGGCGTCGGEKAAAKQKTCAKYEGSECGKGKDGECMKGGRAECMEGECDKKHARAGKCGACAAGKWCAPCVTRKHAPAALEAIKAAEKTLESGDTEAAKTHLAKARKLVAALQPPTKPNKAEAVVAVNAVCPIMGAKIKPADVPTKLVRMHRGNKVGFCCAGCPAEWDKLTDEQKDEKFAQAIKPAPEAGK